MLEIFICTLEFVCSEKVMEDLLCCLLIAHAVCLRDRICASVFPHMPYHIMLANVEHLQQWP